MTSLGGRRVPLGLLLLAAVALNGWAAATADIRVIRATAYVAPDGKLTRDAVLLVRDGVIVNVGEAPADVPVDAYERAIVSPGLIDLMSSLTAVGQLGETTEAIQAQARAGDSLDRFDRHLRQALEAGVTSFVLAPDDRNLVGGRVAVCSTHVPSRDAKFITDGGPMKLSLSPAVMASDREPTSRAGAIALLRSTLAAAAKGEPLLGRSAGTTIEITQPLIEFAKGGIPGIATAPTGADVSTLLAMAGEFKLKLAFIHNDDAREIGTELAKAGAPVIAGPYDLSASPRTVSAAGIFEKAGAKVAVAGGLPWQAADGLRLSAAVAVRNGMSADAARRAITSVPAEVLGLSGKIGSIEKGARADLVVFSGDPLDLRTRVIAVYVGGVRVYSAPAGE